MTAHRHRHRPTERQGRGQREAAPRLQQKALTSVLLTLGLRGPSGNMGAFPGAPASVRILIWGPEGSGRRDPEPGAVAAQSFSFMPWLWLWLHPLQGSLVSVMVTVALRSCVPDSSCVLSPGPRSCTVMALFTWGDL